KAEVYLKSLPEDWQWGILAGIEEAAALLEGQPVDVWTMDEGILFEPYQPVLRIEGTYVEWAQYETALLGLLCQASGIATKAARWRRSGPSTRWSTRRCAVSRSSTPCRTRSSRRFASRRRSGRTSTPSAWTRRRHAAAISTAFSKRFAGSSTCAATITSRSSPPAASTSTRSWR